MSLPKAHAEYADVLKPNGWAKLEAALSDVPAVGRDGGFVVAERGGEISGSVAYFAPGSSTLGTLEPGWAFVRAL